MLRKRVGCSADISRHANVGRQDMSTLSERAFRKRERIDERPDGTRFGRHGPLEHLDGLQWMRPSDRRRLPGCSASVRRRDGPQRKCRLPVVAARLALRRSFTSRSSSRS